MTKVKICGITNPEDGLMAAKLGADALGFVFYEKSPRYLKKEQAREITRELPPFVTRVGLFVNEEESRIKDICEFSFLDAIQLHGDEPPQFCELFEGKKVIKAFRIKNRDDFKAIPRYRVNAILLDTFSLTEYGGTGKSFNWQLAEEAKKFGRIILAGGLTPENVGEAIKTVRPYAVDVSSGVESSRGKKDWKRMEEFMKIVKNSR